MTSRSLLCPRSTEGSRGVWLSALAGILMLLGCPSGSLDVLGGVGDDDAVGDDDDQDGDDDTQANAAATDLEAAVHDTMASIVVLTWTQQGAASARAEYRFDDDEWHETPSYELGDGDQRLLLLGAPFGTEVTWRLLLDGFAVADDAVITTGPAPESLPDVDHVQGDPDAWDADTRWILGSLAINGESEPAARTWSFIVDRQGRMVWAVETPHGRTTFQPMPSVDGTEILVDHNSWWGAFDGGINSQVARWDIEGNSLGFYDTPGMIHPFTQIGDGRIVWGASLGDSMQGERLDISDAQGNVSTLFDCNAFVQAMGQPYCGSNTVWWNPDTDRILFSLFSVEAVVEVDLQGEPVRWFGHLPGAWRFALPDHTFYWQHGTHYLDDGHLILTSRIDDTTEETVVREYELDEGSEELVQVWSYGEGEGQYAYIMGEPRRLPGGNTLVNYGYDPVLREVDASGDRVWEIAWDDGRSLGRTLVVEDLYALCHTCPDGPGRAR